MGSRARARFAIKYIAVPAEEQTRAKLLRLWFGTIVEKTPLLDRLATRRSSRVSNIPT